MIKIQNYCVIKKQRTIFGQLQSNIMKQEVTFGETIKKLRENKGYTLKELAQALGIDTSMLGKIEKNSRRPTKLLIEKLSTLLEINEKSLTITFLSDEVAYQILNEDYASEVLKVAEEKVKYLKAKKKI